MQTYSVNNVIWFSKILLFTFKHIFYKFIKFNQFLMNLCFKWLILNFYVNRWITINAYGLYRILCRNFKHYSNIKAPIHNFNTHYTFVGNFKDFQKQNIVSDKQIQT